MPWLHYKQYKAIIIAVTVGIYPQTPNHNYELLTLN
jgi:hypothetical protein